MHNKPTGQIVFSVTSVLKLTCFTCCASCILVRAVSPTTTPTHSSSFSLSFPLLRLQSDPASCC